MSARFYFDDLHVGQRFESDTVTLDAVQIKGFAAEFDPQPFHLDEAAAAGSVFGGLVASGWHTASATMRLLVQGGAPFVGGMVGAGVEVSWRQPTRPGDTLQVVSEIVELAPSRSDPGRGRVLLRSETRNQHGAVLQIMSARVLVQRRPPSGEAD